MYNHKFCEIFVSDSPRKGRALKKYSRAKLSSNKELITQQIVDKGEEGGAHPSTFPCLTFLQAAGILDDFLTLVRRIGLTSYMQDERVQYATLTKTFVESFSFTNNLFKPYVSFKIYGRPYTMTLKKFCEILGLGTAGMVKKIPAQPTNLLELYRGMTNDDNRRAQQGKIRNIQLPAIRYFAYYLATSVLGRENTSYISNYHLAFLAAALNNEIRYNLGSLIARRLAAKGPIYGGIIDARVVAILDIVVDPN